MGDNERLTLTMLEAAHLLGVSRGLAYDLASQGKIPVIRVGQKRLLVPRKALEDFLAGKWQPAQAGDDDNVKSV
jgi:excisionase family DNA binding protein